MAGTSQLDRRNPVDTGAGAAPNDDFLLSWIGGRTGPNERRQVVVLACGFHPLAADGETVDPEDLAETLARRHSIMAEIVNRYGGAISFTSIGHDLACWGWPQTREDDTRLAVAASLEIVDHFGMQCRCALDAGIAVTGSRNDHGTDGSQLVATAVSHARSMLAMVRPGGILVSSVVRTLLGSMFDLEPFGTPSGTLDEAPRLWTVQGAVAGRRNSTTAPWQDLVGRDREQDTIARAWSAVTAGACGRLFIHGEAGIGKTALLTVLKGKIEDCEAVLIEAHCLPETQGSPLSLARRLLDEVVELGISQSIDGSRSRRPFPTSHDDRLNAGEPTPGTLARSFATMLTGSASAGPIVVAIEDLHWADPQSLDFIATLSGLLTGAAALMLVITSRTPVPACLRSDTRWESIGLTALSADELQLMLVRSPLAPGLPEATRRLIARHAEGIPLYAHELASLTAKGPDRLVSDSHYRLLASPNRLNAALLARLDAVGELKPLAQAAAVLGRTFETRVLAALLEAEPTTLRRRLEALVARGILRPAYQPPGAHYRFSHTLLWTTAYGSILKSRRRQLHARAAVELSTGFPELAETAPERAAHHFTKAGDHATAFAWWRTAALRAEAHGTPATVIGHVNRALAARIAAPEAGTSLDEAQLLSLLGKQLGVLNGRASTDTETAYRRALVLLSQLPSRPADLRFDIQWGLSAFHLVRGETDAAMEASSHLIEAARAAGRNDQLLVALRIHGTAKLLYGCVQDAIDLLRMAAALYDPAIHGLLGYRYVSDQGIVALCHLAWATAIAGDVEASVAAQRKALVLAGERAHAHTSANALGVLSTAASIRGDTGSAAALARACKHLSEAHRFEYWAVRSAFILSWIEGQRDPARGLAMIQDAAVRYRKTGSARAMALLDCLEAEIALHAGKPDLALAALARSDAVGAVRPRFIYASEILRLRALALAATHPLHRSQAVALLEQAERTAVEQGAHTFAGRAAEARARLGNRRVPSLVPLPPMTSMSKLSKE